MNTQTYEIVRRYRGQYQVMDAKGIDVGKQYMSLHNARRLVLALKLQNRALVDVRVLQAAECFTTLTGESLNNYVYQTLIRSEIDELRLLIKKPKMFAELHDDYTERMKQKLR